MRLFPNQIRAIEETIHVVLTQEVVLDIELKKKVEVNKKWGAKDRRTFYEASYNIIRYYELLEYIGKKNDISIIDAYVKIQEDLEKNILDYQTDISIPPHIRSAIPENLWNLYREENQNAEENLQAMQRVGHIFLRINTSLISVEEFSQKLSSENIEHTIISNIKLADKVFQINCIQLPFRTQQHRAFFDKHQHLFDIQDIGSQIITEFIDFSQAEVIIESCAGNGGKTSHILDKTRKNNPLIVAFDKERKKLEHLTTRIARWADHKVVTEMAKEKTVAKFEEMADILCMDMPCTGSGTLKRQADLKYRISKKDIEEKQIVQRELFELFDNTLKKGGTLLYSTCSIFQSENQKQVEYILSKGYRLEADLLLEPRNYNGDGFYVAQLIKL